MQIEECINYLLTGAQHKVFQEMKNELKEYDITPIQYGVLKCIWQLGMTNPKEIADFHNIENSTMSGILERMEAKDLIKREIDDNDRRYIKITLTETSKAMEYGVNKVIDRVNEIALKDFTPEETETLKNMLRKITNTNYNE
ncbi:MAG: MarR family transcriptional regulator [Lachnospiraceae bacterium]|nr:MarR family transcriptional regulator [Lachnospiraceae bacterium]